MDDEDTSDEATPARSAGAQSVMRAIDILYAVVDGPLMLPALAKRVNLNEKTCFRIANALADRGLLATSGRTGFRLGPRLSELGDAYRRLPTL